MKYYVFAIEQIKNDEGYSEFAPAVKKYNTYKEAQTYFFTRLGELANSTSHTYAELKIINSKGGIEKKDQIGAYVEDVAPEEPET